MSLRVLQTISGSKQQHPCLYRGWVGSVEDPDFAKQNARGSAAHPLTDITTKLLKQGLDVPPRKAPASASFQPGTSARYQARHSVNGLLDANDRDNAAAPNDFHTARLYRGSGASPLFGNTHDHGLDSLGTRP
jgi:hypothetical protein